MESLNKEYKTGDSKICWLCKNHLPRKVNGWKCSACDGHGYQMFVEGKDIPKYKELCKEPKQERKQTYHEYARRCKY